MRSLIVGCLVFAAACGGASSTPPPPDGQADAGAPASPAPPPPPPVPSAPPIAGLTIDPSVSARVVVSGLGTLDDIAVAADGTIYVGDEATGRLSAWSPATGQVRLVATGLSHPEGIVPLDAFLVVCEQGKNALSRVDPASGAIAPFRALSNTTGKLGVDGLAFDPLNPSIVVPDSPEGTLLRVSLDGKTATPIPVTSARQPPFQRPTGAFVRPDGTLLVADENAGTLVLRRTDGTLQTLLSGMSQPDDVVEDGQGNVYLNAIGDGVLHRLQGTTHVRLVTGLKAPHGLALDVDGQVLVTDQGGGGRIVKVFVR